MSRETMLPSLLYLHWYIDFWGQHKMQLLKLPQSRHSKLTLWNRSPRDGREWEISVMNWHQTRSSSLLLCIPYFENSTYLLSKHWRSRLQCKKLHLKPQEQNMSKTHMLLSDPHLKINHHLQRKIRHPFSTEYLAQTPAPVMTENRMRSSHMSNLLRMRC